MGNVKIESTEELSILIHERIIFSCDGVYFNPNDREIILESYIPGDHPQYIMQHFKFDDDIVKSCISIRSAI